MTVSLRHVTATGEVSMGPRVVRSASALNGNWKHGSVNRGRLSPIVQYLNLPKTVRT